jgi:hypothetical protein
MTKIIFARNEFPKMQVFEGTVGEVKYTCNCPDFSKSIFKPDGDVAYSWGKSSSECWHIAAVRYYKGESLELAADIPIVEESPNKNQRDPLSRWSKI